VKRDYRVHPARVRLNLAGTSVSAVARDVNLSTSAVSQQLAGIVRLRDDVRDAIVERIGAEAAAEVFDAIPTQADRVAA
jgi:hypothetical protein